MEPDRLTNQRIGRDWADGYFPGEKSSGLAGFLSFLVTGLGQLYAGDVGRGLAWFFGICVGWILTWFFSLFVIGLFFIPVMIGLHIWCIVDAASTATNANLRLRMAYGSVPPGLAVPPAGPPRQLGR